MSVTPGQHYGDYVVDSLVGEGGMAIVARAHHQQTGEVVALKILTEARRADSPGLIDRFHREGEVLEALRSIPTVVGYIDRFRDTEHRADVMVLEFVEGRPLSSVVSESVDVAQVLEWMGHACHALNDMHEAGYVHRDLKPENLMLVANPLMPIRILDFNSAGTALTGNGRLTINQGTFPHTPAYLAPECFDGMPADKSNDVYALGLTFAELLLGHHPLVAAGAPEPETHSAWQHAHETVAFPDLSRVPPALQAVLRDATAKVRRERIPDAVVLWTRLKGVWSDLQADLDRTTLVTEPAVRTEPPRPKRSWGRALVRMGAAVAFIVFLILCAGGGIGTIAQLLQERSDLQARTLEAEQQAKELAARAQLELDKRRAAEALRAQAEADARAQAEALANATQPKDPDVATNGGDRVQPVSPAPTGGGKGVGTVRPGSPQPTPVPAPVPVPVVPAPVPQPPPVQPPPRPVPQPQPQPQPTRPTPSPRPVPTRPTPRPRPTPFPNPRPRPTTTPRPRPSPAPAPSPSPSPAPTPRPRPVPIDGGVVRPLP